jgi:hypothetical protein
VPKIYEAALEELHPTQLTVGLIVVEDKKKHRDRMEEMTKHPWSSRNSSAAGLSPQPPNRDGPVATAVRAGMPLARSKRAKNIPGYNAKYYPLVA